MRRLGLLSILVLIGACVSVEALPPREPEVQDGPREPRPVPSPRAGQLVGDEIVICGQRFSTGAPVVLWNDPGGYNAYATAPSSNGSDGPEGLRYRPGRRGSPERGVPAVTAQSNSVGELGQAVDQFVLHFDVCGLSRTCFDVLHHRRGLSVHFLLDIDGTLYQTLDLRDTAWHATKANDRSIGIEIAQIGARPANQLAELQAWYSTDAGGEFIDIPERYGDGGVRTPNFRGRPARAGLIEGRINGTRLLQHDFTPEQYASLARLIVTLTATLPALELRVPRSASGSIPTGQLSDSAFENFRGILGHYHVQRNKIDPGPAFDWEGLLGAARLHQLDWGRGSPMDRGWPPPGPMGPAWRVAEREAETLRSVRGAGSASAGN